MKNHVKMILGAAAVLLIGLIAFCAWFLSGSGSTEYNSHPAEYPSGPGS